MVEFDFAENRTRQKTATSRGRDHLFFLEPYCVNDFIIHDLLYEI